MVISSEIAKAILDRAQEKSISITPLKLQKLMYYCQGYFLAAYGERMFDENVKAWQHGPVVESVYHQYKVFGSLQIPHTPGVSFTSLSEQTQNMIDYILDSLGAFGAWALRNKTHNEAPWISSYNAAHAGNVDITDAKMTDFFTLELANEQDFQLAKILDSSEKTGIRSNLLELPHDVNTEEDFVNWING
jgi:uncharacterized phage-associated protein